MGYQLLGEVAVGICFVQDELGQVVVLETLSAVSDSNRAFLLVIGLSSRACLKPALMKRSISPGLAQMLLVMTLTLSAWDLAAGGLSTSRSMTWESFWMVSE